jgi:hypothetical protein
MAISSQDADKFRLKHAEELIALFEGARGRPARTTNELAQWLDSVDDDLAVGLYRYRLSVTLPRLFNMASRHGR